MTDKQLFSKLHLPKSTQIGRNFPFQALEKQLSSDERRYFQQVVESRGMRLLATFNPQTTNILKHEDETVRYEEIHLFQLKVHQLKETEVKRVYTMLANIMPYPLIMRFVHHDEAIWILANHYIVERTHQLKVDRLFLTNMDTPEENYLINWHFEQLNKYSLMHFYHDMINQMINVSLEHKHQVSDAQQAIELYEKLEQLEKEIEQYITKAKKEKQLNKRIEWQMKATKLKQQKEQLIKGD